MRSLKDFIIYQLNEGQVDGLKNVSVIRHYTTFAALKSILANGYIEARESRGDEDWEAYNLGEKEVVSFHDVRTDPEWKQALECNKGKYSLDGRTHTLGTNMKKICACIEIDFDKLDKLIQDKSHLLNIYGQLADEFVNYWNEHVKWLAKNKLPLTSKLKLINEGVNKIVKSINDGNKEVLETVKWTIKSGYWKEDTLQSDQGNFLLNELKDIFEKYYSDKELEEKTETKCYHYVPLRYALVYQVLDKFLDSFRTKSWKDEFDENSLHTIEMSKADKLMIEILNQKYYKEYTEDERQELITAVKNFDIVKAIKMILKHGWRVGDTDRLRDANYFISARRCKANNNEKFIDATLLYWVDALMRKKDRIINGNVEIRIPANVEINKENCKIIIFDGIAEAIKQNTALPKKYYNQYNIEHI